MLAPCRPMPRRIRRSPTRSAAVSRSAMTALPTCMSGAWGPVITARSSRWCPIGPNRSGTTAPSSTACASSATSRSRSIAAPESTSDMPLSRRAVMLAAMVMSTPARAQAQAVKVRLGTATPGGGFLVYGEAFVAAIKAQDPALEIEAVNTKGSTENVPMLEAGTLDIALVQGEVVHESLAGIGRPPANLKILTAMYPTAGLFVVRADSPHRRIADLTGKAIAWGAAGSGLVILGRYVMDGLGLDAAKDFQPVYLGKAGDWPAMVLHGRAAALWGAAAVPPGFNTVIACQGG